MVDVLNALLRLVGNADVIRSRHREISSGKSNSFQRMVGHCWRVYRGQYRGVTCGLPVIRPNTRTAHLPRMSRV